MNIFPNLNDKTHAICASFDCQEVLYLKQNPLLIPYECVIYSKMAESLDWFNLKITPLFAHWTNPTASTDLPHSVIACFVTTKITALPSSMQQQFWLIVVNFTVKLIYNILYKALIINNIQLNYTYFCEKKWFYFFFLNAIVNNFHTV